MYMCHVRSNWRPLMCRIRVKAGGLVKMFVFSCLTADHSCQNATVKGDCSFMLLISYEILYAPSRRTVHERKGSVKHAVVFCGPS